MPGCSLTRCTELSRDMVWGTWYVHAVSTEYRVRLWLRYASGRHVVWPEVQPQDQAAVALLCHFAANPEFACVVRHLLAKRVGKEMAPGTLRLVLKLMTADELLLKCARFANLDGARRATRLGATNFAEAIDRLLSSYSGQPKYREALLSYLAARWDERG